MYMTPLCSFCGRRSRRQLSPVGHTLCGTDDDRTIASRSVSLSHSPSSPISLMLPLIRSAWILWSRHTHDLASSRHDTQTTSHVHNNITLPTHNTHSTRRPWHDATQHNTFIHSLIRPTRPSSAACWASGRSTPCRRSRRPRCDRRCSAQRAGPGRRPGSGCCRSACARRRRPPSPR